MGPFSTIEGGGGGGEGIYLFIFVGAGWWQNERKGHMCHKHIGKPLNDHMDV
jgi:hypothetical protein